MDFQFETWTVEKLLKLYKEGKINLKPSYQRNSVWSFDTQQGLIEALKSHSALPSFFLLKKEGDKFEVVDGQQRTSTLILYNDTKELDEAGSAEEFKAKGFLKYPLNITVIKSLGPHEKIEEFYTTINSSGTALNRPEKFKARFFETKFLDLVQKFIESPSFVALDLVPPSSKKRMLDRDLVEEVVALSIYKSSSKQEQSDTRGKNYDKKDFVETVYKRDLSDEEVTTVTTHFESAMKVFTWFNKIKVMKATRYRQRNDFYTLYGFIIDNIQFDKKMYERLYNILLAVEPGIKPDKTGCPPLYEYALNCVSQSNAKTARDSRSRILDELLNGASKTTDVQNKIIKYYATPKSAIEKVGNTMMLVPEVLAPLVSSKESLK
jgi:Protein of unknown function DUF262